jgi:hypothetical protein
MRINPELHGEYARVPHAPRQALGFLQRPATVFSVNQGERLIGEGVTQFYRVLRQLGIELICANTSQAKGRVERAHLTPQDRLVKELRLEGISSINAGNKFLDDENTVYAVEPIPENLKLKHRAITVMTQCDGRMRVRHGKTDLRIVKEHRRASRAAPPMRAGHKDLTVIMNRLIPDHGRFIDLSIEGGT